MTARAALGVMGRNGWGAASCQGKAGQAVRDAVIIVLPGQVAP